MLTAQAASASADLLAALQQPCTASDLETAREILKKHAILDVNLVDASGRTPLHLVAGVEVNAVDLVDALVARGAKVNQQNAHGFTPLQKAVLGHRTDTAIALIRRGADIYSRGARGASAVDMAKTDELVATMKRTAAANSAVRENALVTNDTPDDAAAKAPVADAARRSPARQRKDEALRRLWQERRAALAAPVVSRQRSPSSMAQYLQAEADAGNEDSKSGADNSGAAVGGGAAVLVRQRQQGREDQGAKRLANRPTGSLTAASQRQAKAQAAAAAAAATSSRSTGIDTRPATSPGSSSPRPDVDAGGAGGAGGAAEPLPTWLRRAQTTRVPPAREVRPSVSSPLSARGVSFAASTSADGGVLDLLSSAARGAATAASNVGGFLGQTLGGITSRLAATAGSSGSGAVQLSATEQLALRLAKSDDNVGCHVAEFLAKFEAQCGEAATLLDEADEVEAAEAAEAAKVAEAAEAAAEAERVPAEAETTTPAAAEAAEAAATAAACEHAVGAVAAAEQQEAAEVAKHVAASVLATALNAAAPSDAVALAATEEDEEDDASDTGAVAASATGGDRCAATQSHAAAQPRAAELRAKTLGDCVASVVSFEAALLEALYAANVAQPVEDANPEGGLLELVDVVEGSFMPRCLALLQPLHERVHPAATPALETTRTSLRLCHPEVIGLREALVLSEGLPCATIVEASWLYSEAIDALNGLGGARTVAGRLRCLANVFEALVIATRGRCADGLSADDLVPLLTLALVTSRGIDVAFEGFVLDELLPDVVLGNGKESCSKPHALEPCTYDPLEPRLQPMPHELSPGGESRHCASRLCVHAASRAGLSSYSGAASSSCAGRLQMRLCETPSHSERSDTHARFLLASPSLEIL